MTDPYPNLDFSVLPDLYLSSAVLQGGELPTGAPPTPDTAQDPNSLSQQQQEPRNSLASSTASDSYESVQSAFF